MRARAHALPPRRVAHRVPAASISVSRLLSLPFFPPSFSSKPLRGYFSFCSSSRPDDPRVIFVLLFHLHRTALPFVLVLFFFIPPRFRLFFPPSSSSSSFSIPRSPSESPRRFISLFATSHTQNAQAPAIVSLPPVRSHSLFLSLSVGWLAFGVFNLPPSHKHPLYCTADTDGLLSPLGTRRAIRSVSFARLLSCSVRALPRRSRFPLSRSRVAPVCVPPLSPDRGTLFAGEIPLGHRVNRVCRRRHRRSVFLVPRPQPPPAYVSSSFGICSYSPPSSSFFHEARARSPFPFRLARTRLVVPGLFLYSLPPRSDVELARG